jgi:tetratricopeptide (TPR) repeat protein
MMKTKRFSLFLICLLSVAASAGSLKESWYMYRGRDNMKIGNYKAAIEAFENATRINPDNREASHELGLAYEKQGVIDKAVGQYDSFLGKWPDDPEIALRQARLLKWSRYSYRQADAIKYYKISLNHKNDSQVRLEYADTLASKKETSPQAIAEYQTLLRSQPRNGAAHRGLAKAYAWMGDRDQALYHSRLAREYGDQNTDTKRLAADIEKDRRPALGAEGWLLSQSSSKEFKLNGFGAGAFGRYGLSPFFTAEARAGAEGYWDSTQSKSGGYFGAAGEYRFSPERELDFSLLAHGFAPDGLEAGVSYLYHSEEESWRAGFRRDLIYDSLVSLAGREVAGKKIGAARKQIFFVERISKSGGVEVQLRPYAGWVTSLNSSPNALYGGDLGLVYPLSWGSGEWAATGLTQLMSFAKDQSGFIYTTTSPFGGGYFSPSIYFAQEVLLRYRHEIAPDHNWSVEAGPAYFHVSGTGDNGSKIGGHATARYLKPLKNTLFLQTEADIRRVANVYTQVRAMAWLSYKF